MKTFLTTFLLLLILILTGCSQAQTSKEPTEREISDAVGMYMVTTICNTNIQEVVQNQDMFVLRSMGNFIQGPIQYDGKTYFALQTSAAVHCRGERKTFDGTTFMWKDSDGWKADKYLEKVHSNS